MYEVLKEIGKTKGILGIIDAIYGESLASAMDAGYDNLTTEQKATNFRRLCDYNAESFIKRLKEDIK